MKKKPKYNAGDEVVVTVTGTQGRVQRVLPCEKTQLYVISLTLVVSEEELECLHPVREVE